MIGDSKDGALRPMAKNDGPNTICQGWQHLIGHAMALANQLTTTEPGILKTLKQTRFGPLTDALLAVNRLGPMGDMEL